MFWFRPLFTGVAALALSAAPASAQQYLISTFAGGLPAPTTAAASGYSLGNINGIATDRYGNTYIASSLNCVFRLDPSAMVTRVAGNCHVGFSGDGGQAVNAQLNNPQGVAVDLAGNLYIADQNNQRIRKVTPGGIIFTVAGTATRGFFGDGNLAINAQLNYPQGIAVDNAGNLYIADQVNERIRVVSTSGIITTIAGSGGVGTTGDGGPATGATFILPKALALDSAGNLYIADSSNQVRRVSTSGTVTHFAGTGSPGFSGDSGPAAAAALSTPLGLAVDAPGNLYIADQLNGRVRRVDQNGIITTFAGGNSNVSLGDGGPATSAHLYGPMGVSVDTFGDLYIADQNYRLRRVDTAGTITTAAGTGVVSFGGDGGPAVLAQLAGIRGLSRDSAGNLYVADTSNYRVRKIDPSGNISTFAGNGTCCSFINGAAAASESIVALGLASAGGNLYLGDNAFVAKIDSHGSMTAVAGNGTPGTSGDGGPALNAEMSATLPGLAVDSAPNLYIADISFGSIREVTPDGNINTAVGTGQEGYNGDGGLGPATELNFPVDVALDANGFLYIADQFNNRVRRLADGAVTTFAGNGVSGHSGDGGPATSAQIGAPVGLAVDSSGNLFIATGDNFVREVSGGTISTIAGTGIGGYSGDGGPATAAQFNSLYKIATDPIGNIYVSDSGNNAVRVLQPVGMEPVLVATIAHSGDFIAGQSGATYSVTLSNAAMAATTNGEITVTEMTPPGLTLLSMSGINWQCNSNICSRADPLPGGSNYPPITITVSVNSNAPIQLTNVVLASGGGSLGAAVTDTTSIGSPSPALLISATQQGPFYPAHTGTYLITVGNQAGAAATNSALTVVETLPSSLTLVSMSGPNWDCTNNTCMRSDGISGGSSYPPIIATVTVAADPPAQVTNQVSVSGGGSSPASVNDITAISLVRCDVTGDSLITVSDVQKIVGEALGATSAVDDLNHDGMVNILDVQLEINAALGLGCAS